MRNPREEAHHPHNRPGGIWCPGFVAGRDHTEGCNGMTETIDNARALGAAVALRNETTSRPHEILGVSQEAWYRAVDECAKNGIGP